MGEAAANPGPGDPMIVAARLVVSDDCVDVLAALALGAAAP